MRKMKEMAAHFMRRLYERRLTTTLGGNISVRWTKGRMLITPSCTDKCTLKGGDIGVLDMMEGKTLTRGFRASSERMLHLGIYRGRSDVSAIIHAHTPYASFLASTTVPIKENLSSEAAMMLGNIAYVDYHPPGSAALAEAVAAAAQGSDVIVMRNHGIITLGKELVSAFERMEITEQAAFCTVMGMRLGVDKLLELSPEELSRLRESFKG